MEKLDVFVIGENGQVEIDFNALEALTNKTFVSAVNNILVSLNDKNVYVDISKYSTGSIDASIHLYNELYTVRFWRENIFPVEVNYDVFGKDGEIIG